MVTNVMNCAIRKVLDFPAMAELPKLSSEETPLILVHECEAGTHAKCPACARAEVIGRMSAKELAALKDREAAYIKAATQEPYTQGELRQRFIERFGE